MRCPVTGNMRSNEPMMMNNNLNNNLFPNQLNLNVLHQNSNLSNPMGSKFNYPK